MREGERKRGIGRERKNEKGRKEMREEKRGEE